jgi:hypothetical protein
MQVNAPGVGRPGGKEKRREATGPKGIDTRPLPLISFTAEHLNGGDA